MAGRRPREAPPLRRRDRGQQPDREGRRGGHRGLRRRGREAPDRGLRGARARMTDDAADAGGRADQPRVRTSWRPRDRRSDCARRVVGEWSARELVAHLGYWAGHAVEVIHAVETGRAAEVGIGEPSVDERNETVARVARQTDLATVRKREAASAQALLDAPGRDRPGAARRIPPRRRHARAGHPGGRPRALSRAHRRSAVDGREPDDPHVQDLLAELAAEHDAFVAALEAVDLELVTAPGVVEDWSVRDLVVHVAFWAEHASDALRLASEDRGDEFAYDTAADRCDERAAAGGVASDHAGRRRRARGARLREPRRGDSGARPCAARRATRQRRHRGGGDPLRRAGPLRASTPPTCAPGSGRPAEED